MEISGTAPGRRVRARRLRAGRRARIPTVLLIGLLVAGCSAAPPSHRSSSSSTPIGPTTSALPSSRPTPSVPADGLPLAAFGITHGPRKQFSIPADSLIVASSDQPSLVEVVISNPSPQAVADYLRTALPAGGFSITGDNRSAATPAMSFSGYGWSGYFTGDQTAGGANPRGTSGITLRPRS